ncbi:hypothetical protein CRG98_020824 [Punica granatum]|uniref:Uncharacterized protein n=1 Tax=Punica granatum TaxID=22663 RepID=A0A2I0JR53_PUNGR|nr:hypothetical protein CRG98_020824 [Punica granatum]
MRPSRVPGKVDTLKPRCVGFAHACLDEIKIRVRMDRPALGLRLEAITPLRQEIMRIWKTLRSVDRAFIQGIIGDVVMLTETPVDWIFLRTAIEFWDPQHAVTFPPRRTAYPTASSGPTPHPRPPQDSCRSGRSTVNGTLATYSIYFPEHPTDEERALSATSAYVAQFYSPGLTSPQRSQTTPIPRATPTVAPEAKSSTQAAMRAKLQSIKEKRDRLRCEFVDSRAEVADYRELQTELARARARVAHLDREMARLSATLDRVSARAREISHP